MSSERTRIRANGEYSNVGLLAKEWAPYTIAHLASTQPAEHDETLSPDTLSPNTMSPDTLSPNTLSPNTMSPNALTPNRSQHSKSRHTIESATNLNSSTSSRKKSEPVRSACGQCQKRKTKCSGHRPTCNFCGDRGLECFWDISDGLTRNADLKEKLTKADGHLMDISTVVHDMRTNTDNIATTLLAKLRLGDSIEDLAAGIRAGTSEIMPDTHRRDSYLQFPEKTRNHHEPVDDEDSPSVTHPFAFTWSAPR